METYEAMRQFADSWMLLAMVLFFLGVILRAFSPSRRATMEAAAQIPLQEISPADVARKAPKCDGACETCSAARRVIARFEGERS